jgi:ABC-type Fe3+/spermidine/putrescine transport system ATPase subunit
MKLKNENYLVKIEKLKKTYDKKEIISDFSLGIKAGEVMCLLGTNGSGKTTIVNLLAGLVKPDENGGTVTLSIDGKEITITESKRAFLSYVRLC